MRPLLLMIICNLRILGLKLRLHDCITTQRPGIIWRMIMHRELRLMNEHARMRIGDGGKRR